MTPREILRDELASLIRDYPTDVIIVDCRDDDFTGMKIRGALNYRSPLDSARLYQDVVSLTPKTVVFHCYLSQFRGPTSAREFSEWLAYVRHDVDVRVLRGGFKGWYRECEDLVEEIPPARYHTSLMVEYVCLPDFFGEPDLSPRKITAEMCDVAVTKDDTALDYIPKRLKTPELHALAVKSFGMAIRFIPASMRTSELCRSAVE